MAEPFVHELRVRYVECDAQHVVFNANYLAYIDHTITEMWREAFGSYQVMVDQGLDVVVAETHLRFLRGARFDDVVRIEAAVTHLGTTSLRTHYRFLRGDELLTEATMRHVFVRTGTVEKIPIPDWVRERLERWLAPEPAQLSSSS